MPYSHKIKKFAATHGTTEEQLLRELMQKYRTPGAAAISIGMYPNAIREQLIKRGWQRINGEWVEPIENSA